MITIERQIKCLQREIAMRKRVYPNWVRDERMTQADANEEIATMQAALETVRLHESQGSLFPVDKKISS